MDKKGKAKIYRMVVESELGKKYASVFEGMRGHNRRMAKDYERLCATGEAFV